MPLARDAGHRSVAVMVRYALGIVSLLSWPLGFHLGESIAGARYDAWTYHWPTTVDFASRPALAVLPDYNSATTPLFHMLMAHLPWVQDYAAYRHASFAIGTLTLVLLAAAIHRRFQDVWRDPSVTCLAVAALAWSPSLRDASYWGATDVLPLAFMAAMVWLLTAPGTGAWRERVSGGRTLAVLLLGAAAFYTRQHYAFLCLYGLWLLRRRSALPPVALAAVFMAILAPSAWLFAQWGGLTPPRFHAKQHTDCMNFIILGSAALPWALPFVLAGEWRRGRLRDWKNRRGVAMVGAVAALAGGIGGLAAMAGLRLVPQGGGALAKLALQIGPAAGLPLAMALSSLGWLAMIGYAALALDHVVLVGTMAAPVLLATPFYERYLDPMALCAILLLTAPALARRWVTPLAVGLMFALLLSLEAVSLVWFRLLGHFVF